MLCMSGLAPSSSFAWRHIFKVLIVLGAGSLNGPSASTSRERTFHEVRWCGLLYYGGYIGAVLVAYGDQHASQNHSFSEVPDHAVAGFPQMDRSSLRCVGCHSRSECASLWPLCSHGISHRAGPGSCARMEPRAVAPGLNVPAYGHCAPMQFHTERDFRLECPG